MQPALATLIFLTLILPSLQLNPITSISPCRTQCNSITINYPFSIDSGCGSPHFRQMLNCTTTDLLFQTSSGSYKVKSIDYTKQTITIYDPTMSTCTTLQPHHDFLLSDIQTILTPPTSDTIFTLLNCSVDSPVLNHYHSLCFNFSGHSCDELYNACTSCKIFRLGSGLVSGGYPPCCFTSYSTLKYMSMDILDCSHYTSVYDSDGLKGVGPLDWAYGVKLSYSVPDSGCERCRKSGGVCGYDTETEMLLCLCSSFSNSTRECAGGTLTDRENKLKPTMGFQVVTALILCSIVICSSCF